MQRFPAMQPTFLDLLQQSWPAREWQEVTVLVAVSGGADSVALLRGLKEMKPGGAGRLSVAHFNHRLRGEESTADAAFVAELAASLGLGCEVGSADWELDGADCGDGLEAAARDARYQFLKTAADRVGARFVVTAHTADDQAETILHRVIRGTGIAGLAGIPRTRPLTAATTLLRPMLALRRSEIIEFLQSLGQAYREDASNGDMRFTRNRLRHELLPLLAREFNPQVSDALLRLGSLAAEAQATIQQQIEPLLQHGEVLGPDAIHWHCCSKLLALSDYLLRELLSHVWREQNWPLQAMTHEKWCDLAALARSDAGIRTFPGPILAQKQGEWLLLTCANSEGRC